MYCFPPCFIYLSTVDMMVYGYGRTAFNTHCLVLIKLGGNCFEEKYDICKSHKKQQKYIINMHAHFICISQL